LITAKREALREMLTAARQIAGKYQLEDILNKLGDFDST